MTTQVTAKRKFPSKTAAKEGAKLPAVAAKVVLSNVAAAKTKPPAKTVRLTRSTSTSTSTSAAAAKHIAVQDGPDEHVKVKAKLVRDSFTMPKVEYAAIDALKQRAVALAQPVKKSELLRAGVKSLTSMTDKAFLAAMKAVPSIKTGRPGKA